MHTIQLEVPSLRDTTRAAAADWGPALHSTARSIAAILVAVYSAGLVTGTRWHQLLAWIERHHVYGLSRIGLPGAALPPELISVSYRAPIIQYQAPLALPTLTRRSECHRLRAQGLSAAAIGRKLGISRTTVRRELAA
jgi:hypothetical protein